MEVVTSRFGILETEPDRVLHFPEGLPGFLDQLHFILLMPEELAPFCYLQSVDSPTTAFVVTDPLLFLPEYAPAIPQEAFDFLSISKETETLVMVVVTVPKDIKNITANMAAPLLINVQACLARQVILDTGNYALRHRLMDPEAAEGSEP